MNTVKDDIAGGLHQVHRALQDTAYMAIMSWSVARLVLIAAVMHGARDCAEQRPLRQAAPWEAC